jgi:hypothetical protein
MTILIGLDIGISSMRGVAYRRFFGVHSFTLCTARVSAHP